MTDLLLKPTKQAQVIANPEVVRLKRSFVHFTKKAVGDWLEPVMSMIANRVREEDWHYLEVPFEHSPELARSDELAHLLVEMTN